MSSLPGKAKPAICKRLTRGLHLQYLQGLYSKRLNMFASGNESQEVAKVRSGES